MQCGGIRGHRKTNEPRRGYLMGSEFMRSEIFMAALIFWNRCFCKSTRIADCTRPVARSWFLLATTLTGSQPRERYSIFCYRIRADKRNDFFENQSPDLRSPLSEQASSS